MSAQNILQSSNNDGSPARKRARYDVDEDDRPYTSWSLARNQLILHSVYDSGVSRLDSDSENDLDIDIIGKNKRKLGKSSDRKITASERKMILEASLPENTLQKLTLSELEAILNRSAKETKSNENINYFNLLSDEVILNIFQKLTKAQLCNVALVCRRFYQLAEDESLWTRMDVSDKVLDAGLFGVILSRQVIILRAARTQIAYPPICSNVKLSQPDHWSRLMYLDLTMASISTDSLTMIFQKCKRLKKLSLESVPINSTVLNALSSNCDLEVLNLAMCTGIDLEGLKALLTNCKNLKELNLSWTYLTVDCITYLCEYLPSSLSRLNLSGCRKLLSDNHVTILTDCCQSLTELDLSDCTSITGESIHQIATLDQLNFLSLSRCYAIPYRSLLYLKKMKNLSYLDIHGSYINDDEHKIITDGLGANININKFKFSSIARPAVGNKKSSIWNMRIKD